MAITIRIPESLDARLDEVAAQQHTSKSALLLQGASWVVERHDRRGDIAEGLDFVLTHDAELLTRLEDA
ncbi:MAG: ribbon-helix-helix protein, CopG family [Pseudolysinimonas sp.]|uniref:ribbon-helix-helix protein, CopG family n=1 Tax=Pseudolysinimonas sp. TaxID=2680009 RepID=UPI003264FE12